MHLVKALAHQFAQFDGLPAGFQVSQKYGMGYEVFLSEVIESGKELLTCRVGRDVHIGTPDLLEYPSQQAERVDTCAEERLQGAITQRTQILLYRVRSHQQ